MSCIARSQLSALVGAAMIASTPITSSAQGPTTSADSLELAKVIYGVALTNGTQTAHSAAQAELVCVQGPRAGVDPPSAILDALQKDRSLLIRPMSACRQEPLMLQSLIDKTSLIVDTVTGKRGISISAGEPKFGADETFTVTTGYYQHGLSSAQWTCSGRRRADRSWEIARCTLLWIS